MIDANGVTVARQVCDRAIGPTVSTAVTISAAAMARTGITLHDEACAPLASVRATQRRQQAARLPSGPNRRMRAMVSSPLRRQAAA
jgi:hypothetical protein